MTDKGILKQIYAKALKKRQENALGEQTFGTEARQPAIPEAHAKPRAVVQDTPVSQGKPKVSQAEAEQLVSERELLMRDLLGVYREKRQMIDELPEKHRKLLEKIGHTLLGTVKSKQPPKSH